MTSGIPEEKATVIAMNYNTKVELVKDFQRGITISLQHEKQKQKHERIKTNSTVTFSMICGIPGSGKTENVVEVDKKENYDDETYDDGFDPAEE